MKEWTSKWNPFNSDKLLVHVNRWSLIKKYKPIPHPVTISIDPINACNLQCVWCNSDNILKHNKGMINSETLSEIADFLANWQGHPDIKKGVESICIGGGGESLLNPNVGSFIDKCFDLGIKIGIVTNGINVDKNIESLLKCTWVGVSVDAGSKETYEKLKKKKEFDKVIDNIKKIVEAAKNRGDMPLGKPGQGPGISYKYLLHPANVMDLYEAAQIAKKCGCKNMHVRPFGEPWDKIGQIKEIFSYSDIIEFREQLNKARQLEDNNFKVFGVTHKFDGNFKKSNEFKNCKAIFMTGVFMPPEGGKGNFDFSFCCDRRGDDNLTLHNLISPIQVGDFWGKEEHWKMLDKINTSECPRCTYQPHNIIYEKVIEEDNTTYQFI